MARARTVPPMARSSRSAASSLSGRKSGAPGGRERSPRRAWAARRWMRRGSVRGRPQQPVAKPTRPSCC